MEESLSIEQHVLGKCEAAVYGLYMRDNPQPASVLALTAQAVTWEQIQERSREDSQLQELLNLLQQGAPDDREQWPPRLRMFFPVRAHLSIQEPVILYKERVVVPLSLRSEVLDILHSGNGGVTSMTSRARVSVWWPGITRGAHIYQ